VTLVVTSNHLPFILIPLSYGSYVPTIRFILRLQAAVASNSRSTSLSCTSRRQHYQPPVNSSSIHTLPRSMTTTTPSISLYIHYRLASMPAFICVLNNQPFELQPLQFPPLEIHTTGASFEAPDIMVGVERIVDMLRVTPVLWKG